MRVPLRFTVPPAAHRWIAAAVIAVATSAVVLAVRATPEWARVSIPLDQADWVMYDSAYRLRPIEDRSGSSVVCIAVDQESLNKIAEWKEFGWPWPRQFWGVMAAYLGQCGAKAVVIDLLFDKPSVYVKEFNDDELFVEAVQGAEVPVILAATLKDGEFAPLAPKLEGQLRGAVRISSDETYRDYRPLAGAKGRPSLAFQAVQSAKMSPPGGGKLPEQPFLIHYHGPHFKPDRSTTYPFLSAKNVLAAALKPETAADNGIEPAMFKDKIVVIGAITPGAYDLKFTPLSTAYPGMEVHATAIDNIILGQQVHRLGFGMMVGITLLAALLAAIGAIVPRQVMLKLLASAAAPGLVVGAGIALFRGGKEIYWLPLAAPLLATFITTLLAFAWSYFTEDRNRRFFLKALSQYVSPDVVAELEREPHKLALYGQRREMTVLFSDIAGFTDMSETVEVERLTDLLNFYLDEMSAAILIEKGTVDKYIGDSVMGLWNAPLSQTDHAVRACRAALGMQRREIEIQPRLRELGATQMYTRIGINSGPMAVGNMGSSLRFSYTVLGDSVNLGSRLESANKMYGTQVLISESTAKLVRSKFTLRELDLLRVKGKKKPIAVFELIAEGEAEAATRSRIERYESALSLYRQQKWAEARRVLLEIRREFRQDGPTKTLLRRIRIFRRTPPPPNWDGVYVAKEK